MSKASNHQRERRSISWEEISPKDRSDGSTAQELWAPKHSKFDFTFNSFGSTARKSSVTNQQKIFHSADKTESSTPPPPSTSKPRISIKLRRKSSSRFLKGLFSEPKEQIIGKKRKDREDDSEDEGEDDGKQRLQVGEKAIVVDELYFLAREWIDPLLDMTLDCPSRITERMLVLRTCIEKALKKDVMTDEEVVVLREAVEKAKRDAADADEHVEEEDDELSV